MEKYFNIKVVALPSGIVRVYGNSGMIFEACAEYVQIESYIDPTRSTPSGEGPVKKK